MKVGVSEILYFTRIAIQYNLLILPRNILVYHYMCVCIYTHIIFSDLVIVALFTMIFPFILHLRSSGWMCSSPTTPSSQMIHASLGFWQGFP